MTMVDTEGRECYPTGVSGEGIKVEEMSISKFKATCLAVLERVRKTGEPILVTRFGHPVAEIVAPGALKPMRRLGTMAGSGRVIGDIVGAIGDESDWESAQE
jgi:prevent-host-death family protein